MGDKEVAAAVNKVGGQVKKLTSVVTRIGQSSKEILDCLVSGPTPPDLLTDEKIVPTAAEQTFDKTVPANSTLTLTLTTPTGAPLREVELVFEGVEKPEPHQPISGTASGQNELTFLLPGLWYKEQKPRFVTVNIIDPKPTPPPPTPPPPTPLPPALTMRRILPATVPNHDEDDD